MSNRPTERKFPRVLLVVEPESAVAKGMLWARPEVIAHRFRLVEVDESVLLVEFEDPDGMGQVRWIAAHGHFIDDSGGDIYYMTKAYLWGIHKAFLWAGITVADAIIIGDNGSFTSLRQSGDLEP